MKRIITTLAMVFCLSSIYSQATLNFCASVEQSGYCNFNNNKFFITPDSTSQRVFMEVRDMSTFAGISKVIFKVYTVGKNGEEKYDSMSEQPVKDDWMFAWLPHVFNGPAKYDVKIFNDKDELMCSKVFELFASK